MCSFSRSSRFVRRCLPRMPCSAAILSTPASTTAPGVSQFTRVKWQFHTDGQVFSSPAVAGGTRLCRQHRPQSLRRRSRDRHAEMEVQNRKPRHFVACGFRRPRLLRKLRRQLLCRRRCDRQSEMEIQDRRRAALRRQAPPRRAAGRGNHARSLRLLSFVSGGLGTAPSISAAATTTSTRSTPPPAR